MPDTCGILKRFIYWRRQIDIPFEPGEEHEIFGQLWRIKMMKYFVQ